MSDVRVAVIPAPGEDVEIRTVPLPDLEPDSALLSTELSEVCGTDVHLQRGRLAEAPYPLVPGHVSVGRLDKIRGQMFDVHGRALSEGDRVTFFDVHRTCNRCWYCTVGQARTRCPHRKVYGITYGLKDGLCGGWAEKIYLKPATQVIPLDGVPTELFMAGGCSLPTALHAVERADIRFADSVLVLGSGPVGLSCIILAALRGAGRVLCVGAPNGRLQIAQRVGAAATLNFQTCGETERLEWVRSQTDGRGTDVTIEASGDPNAVVQAMRFTRDAGRVVVVGQYTDAGNATFNPHLDLNKKHLAVLGCWGSDFSHFHRGVELLKTAAAQRAWSKVELERFSLSQANEALAAVAAGRCVKAIISPELEEETG